jgi:hypothetical protein
LRDDFDASAGPLFLRLRQLADQNSMAGTAGVPGEDSKEGLVLIQYFCVWISVLTFAHLPQAFADTRSEQRCIQTAVRSGSSAFSGEMYAYGSSIWMA